MPQRTSKAHLQEHERLEGSEELPNTKPMMELKAGSNVWYQAYVLKESINEAKVRFPGELKTAVMLRSRVPHAPCLSSPPCFASLLPYAAVCPYVCS